MSNINSIIIVSQRLYKFVESVPVVVRHFISLFMKDSCGYQLIGAKHVEIV